ncbi:MAG: HmuY family protein [Bacteroidota bacterium]
MKIINRFLLMFMLLSAGLITACSDDDDTPLPVMGVAFQTSAVGISGDATTADVTISFSRATSVENTLLITVSDNGVVAGQDYSISPAITGNTLQMTIPAGSESASLTVTRLADIIAPGSNVTLTITSIDGEPESQIAGNTSITVNFEAIASPGSNIVAQIGGGTEPNQVFIDLSLNNQTTAERVSWDLGFFNGSEDKVILNYSTYTMAQAIDKTDINSITPEDTLGFSATMRIGTAGAHIFVDNPDRDLDKLAIDDISSNDADNKVYIINRGGGPGAIDPEPGSVDVGSTPRGWKKIRILKDGSDYVIQYADLDATTFNETRISKNSDFNFNYFSFENGADISVEPKKDQWDFVFSVSSNIINFGGGDGAYGFSDFVLSNRSGGTQVAAVVLDRDEEGEILPGQTSYDDFDSDDLGTVEFSENGNTIGSSWRSVFSRTAHNYAYFIVKDSEGNNYKVQFLGLLNESGERGNSSFKYELL